MKKYLKLLWVILLIVAIIFCFENFKFIKSYYRNLVANHKTCSFSIFTKTIANDTFFSIPLGERVLKEGFKTNDILTWHEELEFTNDRWLFNVIIYLVYTAWGINGITNFVTICTLFVGFLLLLVLKDRTKNLVLSIFGTLFVMYFSRMVFHARAQILSFPLFILEFWILEKLIETQKKKYSIFLIIIAWLIANIHASVFPIFFVIFLPYFAEWILGWYRNSDVKNIKILGVTFLISLLVGLLTPTGFTPYTILIRAFLFTDTSFIGECQPSNIYNNLHLFVFLVVSICLVHMPKIKVKTRDYFFIFGFGIMGILVFRGTFFFYFISSTSFFRVVIEVIKQYNLGLDSKWVRGIIILSICMILTTTYLKHFLFMQRDDFVPKDIYPVEAVDYILEHVDYKNMKIYNGFNYGSYLEFRGIKSFMDSRSEVFTDEFNPGCTILEDWLNLRNDSLKYREIFDKYGITHAIVHAMSDNINLEEDMKKDSNWKIIYQDNNFVLFERIGEI